MILKNIKNSKFRTAYFSFIFISIIILVLLSQKNNLFVGSNLVLNVSSLEFRTLQKSEFISCQPDCSFLDNKFHEECVGFNGCKDNIFLRDKNYCEDDSDCTYFFGCCASECVGSECFNAKFCPVTNKIFSKAQKLSCENIDCVKKSSCKVSKRIVCVNNACLI